MLFHADNLAVLRELRGKFRVAYLDPPFRTGRVFRTRDGETAFSDRASPSTYLADTMSRVRATHRVLTEDGCLLLHADERSVHQLKVACDEAFGAECFAGEIVWHYRRWNAAAGSLARNHDTILRYVRRPGCEFYRRQYQPLSPSTVRYTKGKRQRAAFIGQTRVTTVSEVESPGAPLGDVWSLSILGPTSHERTGYPTQKPETLMTRLLECFSAPGDWVLEPYAGSASFYAAARKCGRRCVAIDSGAVAIRVASERLGIAPIRS